MKRLMLVGLVMLIGVVLTGGAILIGVLGDPNEHHRAQGSFSGIMVDGDRLYVDNAVRIDASGPGESFEVTSPERTIPSQEKPHELWEPPKNEVHDQLSPNWWTIEDESPTSGRIYLELRSDTEFSVVIDRMDNDFGWVGWFSLVAIWIIFMVLVVLFWPHAWGYKSWEDLQRARKQRRQQKREDATWSF